MSLKKLFHFIFKLVRHFLLKYLHYHHYIPSLFTAGGKRKPSFKMVSNMVIQLLHTIKFSMEVPFSNMTQQPVEMQKTLSTKNKVIIHSFHLGKCEMKHILKQLNGDVGPVSILLKEISRARAVLVNEKSPSVLRPIFWLFAVVVPEARTNKQKANILRDHS